MKLGNFIICVGLLVIALSLSLAGCESESSDRKQNAQQEILLQEATSQTGMPNIVNFRERKLLKDILELRDQEGLTTYTYFYCEMTGELVFFGETIGYGIPYSTQYTNPQKPMYSYSSESSIIPQADPTGLFSPESAEGTWVMLVGPDGSAKPVYVEPRIIVSPFRLK